MLSIQLNKQNKDFTPNHIQISNDISISNPVLAPKTNKIFDDYFISNQVLGLGLNGEVSPQFIHLALIIRLCFHSIQKSIRGVKNSNRGNLNTMWCRL